MEDQLRASHREVRDLKTALDEHAMVGITDPHGRMTYVNDKFCRVSQYSREELLGQDLRLVSSHHHSAAFFADLWTTITGGKVWHGEIRNRAKGSGFYWVDTTIVPFLDAQGRPRQYVTVQTDITERKRGELALLELAAIVDSSDDAIIAKDLNSIITSWNRGAERIFGYSAGEMIGSSIFRLIPADRHGEEHEILRRISRGEKVDHFETRRQTKDGRLIDVSVTVSPILDAAGRVIGASKVARDISARKQAESALQASEGRYRTLFAHAPNGILIADRESTYLDANASMCRMLGYKREELIGRNASDIVAPSEIPQVGPALKEIQDSALHARQWQFRRKDGSTFQGEVIATKMQDGNLMAVVRDITERMQAESALRESNLKFTRAFANNPAAIALTRLDDGLILEVNDTWVELCGYSRAEMIGRSARGIWPSVAAAAHFVDVLREKGVLRGWEEQFRKKSGELFVAELSSQVMEMAGEKVILSTLVDVTARKRAEEAVRASEERFRQVVENIREVFWMTDQAKNQMLYISPAYHAIWGRTCESLYADPRSWHASIHPDDRERVAVAAETKQTAGTYDETYRIVRPDGKVRWIRDRAFPIRGPGGVVSRVVGTAEDVTHYRTLEEQFRQAQKMEAIGTLAGGIAHDFNNILAAINGYTELARMILKDNPQVREHLGAVLQATGRATDLVRQILTFSRQQPQERRLIQLRPVVAECLDLLRATLPSTIEFDVSLATDAPTVLADATQIHQILMNLGTNAWHAMKDRPGRLQVRLERCIVDAAHAAVQSQLQPGVYARVSVSDTGCGMDQATLQRIFEPFFTTKAPGEGTGLGLSVVHGIMNSHEGAVTVYSQPGEGTVFHLYFPGSGAAAVATAVETATVPSGRGERILFVDDEELLVRLGQKTLTALGYEVEVAIDPAVACAMVRADPQRFALVLTDHTMSGMTGMELAAQLRHIRPDLAIILMTGYTASLTPERIEAAGIRQLLLKPTTLHSLGTAVASVLAQSKPL